MAISGTNCKSQPAQVDAVGTTADTLTSRAGMLLFSRYLRRIGLMPHLKRLFGSMRKSRKGLPITALLGQVLCFFVDGTSPHIVHFDRNRQDAGYAGTIETPPGEMASSHQVKRFFAAFSWPRIWLFRTLLQQLFLWRLKREQPDVVILGLDTMVMDNSEAQQRHGVAPTYKRGVRGFKPLQLTWGPYVIDAVFRGGKKHCNHGQTAIKMLTRVAERIRKSYRDDVPIIIRADSAFFDQKIFKVLEARGLWYVIGGRLDEATKALARRIDPALWDVYQGGRTAWAFREVWRCLGRWDRYRRAIYTYTWAEDEQLLLPFDTEQIVYTNLSAGARLSSTAEQEALAPYVDTCGLIKLYHDRGCDELVHRALKDFREEQLPFKRFSMNAAFYYVMLVAFFLFEAFKRDVTAAVIAPVSYATRLRRRVFDVAGKLVRHAHRLTLKVTEAVWQGLGYGRLWKRANAPPVFSWS